MADSNNYLFVTWDGGGNVPPVLALARRVVNRGHCVTVLAEPSLEEAVVETGATFVPFNDYFTRMDPSEDLIKDWNAKPLSIPAVENILVNPASGVAKETAVLLREHDIDVLVADFMMIGGLFAAEAMGIKRVALFHMPEYLAGPGRPPGGMGLLPSKNLLGRLRDRLLASVFHKVLNQYLGKANQVRKELKLPGLDNLADVFHQADLRLIQTCKDFDAPLDPAPDNLRYVGPVLDDPSWVQQPLEHWGQPDDRPFIVVSLSTTFQNQAATLRQIIKALSTVDARVLVTVGPAMTNEFFDVAEHIKVVHSVPHSQVFPHADLVITHAGHGTVMRALSFGLPLICLPMGRDQIDNAALLAYRGAGIKLSPNAQASRIRKSVLRVLLDKRFKKHAQGLQESVLRDAKSTKAEDYLEDLASA